MCPKNWWETFSLFAPWFPTWEFKLHLLKPMHVAINGWAQISLPLCLRRTLAWRWAMCWACWRCRWMGAAPGVTRHQRKAHGTGEPVLFLPVIVFSRGCLLEINPTPRRDQNSRWCSLQWNNSVCQLFWECKRVASQDSLSQPCSSVVCDS